MRRAQACLALVMLAVVVGTAGARAAGPMLFRDACVPAGQIAARIVIAGVGDLLFHEPLQRQALTPETDYQRYFAAVAPVLTGADITYGNLEGPAAHGVVQGGKDWKDPGRVYDGKVYGTAKDALIFNYHPSVAGDLKAAGFKVVSTANNHAADRRALGIDRTIEALETAGLAYTGTRRRVAGPEAQATAQLAGSWSTVTETKGLRVAWLACTFGTNNMPDRDGQVLLCYQSRDTVMAELARLSRDPSISAVILTPHWGDEGSSRPKASDRLYARAAIEAGATAVIGTHPHVLQPWERVETSDGRDGLVIYSTGNFLSNQHTTAQRSGVIALLELTRAVGTGKARLTAAGFVPTWVDKENEAGHRIVEQVDGGRYVGEPAPAAKLRPVAKRAVTLAARAAAADGGLAATLKLLPANRVAMASFRDLPRNCPVPDAMPPQPLEPPQLSMVMADAAEPAVAAGIAQSQTAVTLRRVAGAISFVVAALPRLPAPPPVGRADPVLRTRRPDRPGDSAPLGHLTGARDSDKTWSVEAPKMAAAEPPPERRPDAPSGLSAAATAGSAQPAPAPTEPMPPPRRRNGGKRKGRRKDRRH